MADAMIAIGGAVVNRPGAQQHDLFCHVHKQMLQRRADLPPPRSQMQ